MLVTLKEILALATKNGCAIGAFNTPNLESLQAVLAAAEELNTPVIIAHAEVHEPLMPLQLIGPVMMDLAKQASVPVCVHLDHGTDLNHIRRALELGFTSVMYDGSTLPYEENVSNSRTVVQMAAASGASVEGEIGTMGSGSADSESAGGKRSNYTDPEEAARFVRDTGIDALACSFGTVHGLYTSEPCLDFEVLEAINARITVPIVMHGGSGVSVADYRKVIAGGVKKINYYTYMAKAGGEAATAYIEAQSGPVLYHDLRSAIVTGMKENAAAAMKVFSGQ